MWINNTEKNQYILKMFVYNKELECTMMTPLEKSGMLPLKAMKQWYFHCLLLKILEENQAFHALSMSWDSGRAPLNWGSGLGVLILWKGQ